MNPSGYQPPRCVQSSLSGAQLHTVSSYPAVVHCFTLCPVIQRWCTLHCSTLCPVIQQWCTVPHCFRVPTSVGKISSIVHIQHGKQAVVHSDTFPEPFAASDQPGPLCLRWWHGVSQPGPLCLRWWHGVRSARSAVSEVGTRRQSALPAVSEVGARCV